jgi:ABC-2 type transport system permease protein
VSSADTTARAGLGRPILGPTALGDDPRRLWILARSLAVTDFRLKFFGSVLGYLWQLMRPLLLFGVLYTVFTVLLDVQGDEPYYGVSLLMGIVLFSFFSEATGGSVRSLVMREGLVRKIQFPRLAVPLATVLTALLNLSLNLVPVFAFLLIAGGTPRWTWLEFPILVAVLSILVLGIAMLLSALFVRYRDVEPIWDVVVQVMFYGSPILYTLSLVREKASPEIVRLLLFNPFAAILEQSRHAIVDPAYESTSTAMGSTVWLLVPLAIVAVVVTVGYVVFSRAAPRIAEEL